VGPLQMFNCNLSISKVLLLSSPFLSFARVIHDAVDALILCINEFHTKSG